jgi:hypothetical protein
MLESRKDTTARQVGPVIQGVVWAALMFEALGHHIRTPEVNPLPITLLVE